MVFTLEDRHLKLQSTSGEGWKETVRTCSICWIILRAVGKRNTSKSISRGMMLTQFLRRLGYQPVSCRQPHERILPQRNAKKQHNTTRPQPLQLQVQCHMAKRWSAPYEKNTDTIESLTDQSLLLRDFTWVHRYLFGSVSIIRIALKVIMISTW